MAVKSEAQPQDAHLLGSLADAVIIERQTFVLRLSRRERDRRADFLSLLRVSVS